MIGHAWHSYWSQAGGNIIAMPLQFVITAVTAFVFRGPLGRLLCRDALREAEVAARIAADLYKHHVGRAHPAAPGQNRTPSGVPDSGNEGT